MKIAIRIGYNRYYDDAVFEEHLRYVQRNLDVIDEITIFSENNMHADWILSEQKTHAALIQKRIEQYRAIGAKSVGVNVLNTIGHIDEAWDLFPKSGLQHFVAEDGTESKSSLCYVNDAYREFIYQKFVLYAATSPDFIWLDDDIRVEWHVAGDGCFCPHCVSLFSKECGREFSRETLVATLAKDERLSDQWLAFRRNQITSLISLLEEAIHGVDPHIEIGFMTGPFNARLEWLEASRAVKGRPGGGRYGFYTEESPITVFEKGFAVEMSIANYPSVMTDIQHECENMCYQTFGKSMHSFELETTQAVLGGCNGILYNYSVYDDRQDVMDMARSSKAKWKVLCNLTAQGRRTGVYCVDSVTSLKLNELSIPTTPHLDHAVAAFVVGEEWNRLSSAEWEAILQLPILTDGRGLEILCARGVASRCGGHVHRVFTNGMSERFSVHPLNGDYAGYYRDVIMNYIFEGNAYELLPCADAEEISRLETVRHQPLGCSFYLYENADGERFAADGYLMPSKMSGIPKRTQIVNVLDWLSEGKLPVVLDRPLKVVSIVTERPDGGTTIMLTNAYLDSTGSFTCTVRKNGQFSRLLPDGRLVPLSCQHEMGQTKISIENIEPWNYIIMTDAQ